MKSRSEHQHRRTSRRLSAGRLLCLILAMYASGTANHAHAYAAGTPEASSAAATVNGAVITQGAYQRELESATQLQDAKAKLAREAMLAQLKQETLENLITRELLLQESRRRNIKADAAAIDREYKEFKGKFADENQYTETMSRMKLSEAQVREQIAEGIAIRTLLSEAIDKKITVSADEAKSYYDRNVTNFAQPARVHLGHILISVPQDATREQKKAAADKAADVRKQLAGGADFATLAARYSDDDKNKTRAGDIGWFAPSQMAPELSQKIAALKVGEATPVVVEDRLGLHLFKVMESKAAFTPTFDEIKDQIIALIRQEKGQKELPQFVKQLRDRAKVEIRLPGDNT